MTAPKPSVNDQTLAYWLVFSNDRIVCHSETPALIHCTWAELDYAQAYREDLVLAGEHQGTPCYVIDMQREQVERQDIATFSLRSFFLKGGKHVFELVARAWQLILFLRTHRFCGQCGGSMEYVDWEFATQCHTCGHRCYPRISPCIIVAIRKGDQLLLAQGKTQKERKMYSILAGFVESGESLEQAVHREVFEEVGIKVNNLEYFGSQPWPFPHSLMIGYFADYESGDIVVDGDEILEADWYDIDDLPFVPPNLSIAGQLIEETIRRINEQK